MDGDSESLGRLCVAGDRAVGTSGSAAVEGSLPRSGDSCQASPSRGWLLRGCLRAGRWRPLEQVTRGTQKTHSRNGGCGLAPRPRNEVLSFVTVRSLEAGRGGPRSCVTCLCRPYTWWGTSGRLQTPHPDSGKGAAGREAAGRSRSRPRTRTAVLTTATASWHPSSGEGQSHQAPGTEPARRLALWGTPGGGRESPALSLKSPSPRNLPPRLRLLPAVREEGRRGRGQSGRQV